MGIRRYLWWGPLQITAMIFAVLIALVVWADRSSCAKIMRYARTTQDSLVATIACEKGGDAGTAAAISSGIIAGSIAGSARVR
jgi:hypothetical protein